MRLKNHNHNLSTVDILQQKLAIDIYDGYECNSTNAISLLFEIFGFPLGHWYFCSYGSQFF